MTRLGGYQPHYFPRLHCIARILNSDVSPIADYVQYVRKHSYPTPQGKRSGPSYQAQTPLKVRGGVLLLGVPVLHAGQQRICDAKVCYGTPWFRKHLNIIEAHYRAAPRFGVLFPQLKALLEERHETLADLSIKTLVWGLSVLFEVEQGAALSPETLSRELPYPAFRIKKIPVLSRSVVPPPNRGGGRDPNEWIIDMCRHYGAKEFYFGGTAASAYMDQKRLEEAGISLIQQDWRGEEYPQQFGAFMPNLSIIDLLMNVPPARAREILKTPGQ